MTGNGISITPSSGDAVSLSSSGLDNGNNQITNVAAGTADTDAVNVSQLKDAQAAATTKVEAGTNMVVTPTTNSDGSTTYTVATSDDPVFNSVTAGGNVLDGTAISVDGTTYTNVSQAINTVATQAYSPLTFAGDSGTNVERKLGTTVNIVGGNTGTLSDNNIGVVADGTDTLTVKLAKQLTGLTSAEFTDSSGNVTSVTGNGISITPSSGDAVSLSSSGLDNGNNQITNVAAGTADTDAVNVSQLKAAQAAATTTVAAGKNMEVTTTTNSDGSTTYTVATSDNLVVDSVTAGDTVLNSNGVTVGDNVALTKDGLTVGDVKITTDGIDAGGNKVTNVAAGEISATSTDAVNGSQLYAVQQQAAAAKTEVQAGDNISVTSTTGSSGQTVYTVSANTTTLTSNTDGTVSSGGDGLVTGTTVANAINNSGWTLTANGSDGSKVSPGTTVDLNNSDGNVKITKSGSNVTFDLNPDLNVTSVTTGNTTMNTDGVTVSGGSNGDVSLTSSGLNNGGNTITNVAAGVNDTDAVNVGQLNTAIGNINSSITNIAGKIDGVAKDANAGIAGAMASAGIPQAYVPGKSMVAAAGSTYRGASAIAIGVSTISDSGKWVFKGSVNSNSRGHVGATIGAGYQW